MEAKCTTVTRYWPSF